jgi:hypothetical protein
MGKGAPVRSVRDAKTAGQRPISLERTTGFEPATPTLAKIAWRVSHASLPVSAVSLTCMFLALLSHPSQQIAGVDSISLVISLVFTGRAAGAGGASGDDDQRIMSLIQGLGDLRR